MTHLHGKDIYDGKSACLSIENEQKNYNKKCVFFKPVSFELFIEMTLKTKKIEKNTHNIYLLSI